MDTKVHTQGHKQLHTKAHATLRSALGIAGLVVAAHAAAQVTFYESENLRGRSFTTDRTVENFQGIGFNDRAASAVVESGRWEVCEDARFGGRCVVLRPGRYESLGSMNLNYQISSVRPVGSNAANDNRPGYAGAQGYDSRAGGGRDYQRRNNERVYEANVTSVHAVVGPPEQRCWIERERVTSDDGRNGPNVGGAVVGAVIGGILGHQIGGGRGNDLATAGGAVGGAALGANVGRGDGDGQQYSQDVRRCANVSNNARPDYWDVTYSFQGQEHHVQMSAPPGRTITVNGDGEPRV